ncbi:MAG: class I SAM-dependent methyltransferase [Oligoflexia bacterium]|nr:class I SAM-dependent methyltransferase [Oligoflexia bacterium]
MSEKHNSSDPDISNDLFSSQSVEYLKYRPEYPPELFSLMASLVTSRKLAWDAGCGSGQAAFTLAQGFERVFASDIGAGQIATARSHPRVQYMVCPAEDSALPAESVDLATAAAAAHWFNESLYFTEVKRVLRPGGVAAIWGYSMPMAGELGPLVTRHYWAKLAAYWPDAMQKMFSTYGTLENYYRSFSWQLHEIEAPSFHMRCSMNRNEFLSYLGTWSAAEVYRRRVGSDPLSELREVLEREWQDGEEKVNMFSQIYLRIGRKVD